MSYQEKRTITMILTGIILLSSFVLYAVLRIQADIAVLGDLKFWAIAMLVFIGIGIGATILTQILFHIVFAVSVAVVEERDHAGCDEGKVETIIKREMVEDERDKSIELKSNSIGYAFSGFGFLAGLILLAVTGSAVYLLFSLFGAFSIGSILEGFVKLNLYRKGC
ncbi:MAG: hypothetical protein Q8N15_02385 [Bacillota bacterium]|nr:hypothetical protein [Bacillota bacterium]